MAGKIGGYSITEVVKNLIIINLLFFLATDVVDTMMASRIGPPFNALRDYFGLYYFDSALFRPFQIVTSMFTHGGITHFALNMLTLFFLGPMIENALGAKRFLILYLLSGVGASVFHTLGNTAEIAMVSSKLTPENIEMVREQGYQVFKSGKNYFNEAGKLSNSGILNAALHQYAVGASGCISGVVMALGMLFPNVELYLMFIPVPIKAKHIALFSVVISLILGVLNFSSDPIAHFAHLGGLVTGYCLLRYWKLGYLLK